MLSGATGLPLYGTLSAPSSTGFGYALADVGDVTGDGWADVIIGSPAEVVAGGGLGTALVHSPLWCQPSIGYQGPGSAQLSFCGGKLSTGGKADLTLHGAAPYSLVGLVASHVLGSAPFKDGTLVPCLAPGFMVLLSTDGTGSIWLPSIDGGFGPFDVFLQDIIQDPTQPHGFALSNAVWAHFLP